MDKIEVLSYTEIRQTRVLIRGGGEQATGVVHRLHKSGFKVCCSEISHPLAVRRMVSFSEAVYDQVKTVEGVKALLIDEPRKIFSVWESGEIPILVDPENKSKDVLKPHVLVDAILAKRNLGTNITDAPLVIGLGPGFEAPKDVDVVIETNRGHDLGKLIFVGKAEPNTGVPGIIMGYGAERVLRSPSDGVLKVTRNIGDIVDKGELLAHVEGVPIRAKISGVIRGLLRNGTIVHKGLKVGDVDSRGNQANCFTISEKARALGGAVMEAILSQLPKKTAIKKQENYNKSR